MFSARLNRRSTCGPSASHVVLFIICPTNLCFREPASALRLRLGCKQALAKRYDVMIDNYGMHYCPLSSSAHRTDDKRMFMTMLMLIFPVVECRKTGMASLAKSWKTISIILATEIKRTCSCRQVETRVHLMQARASGLVRRLAPRYGVWPQTKVHKVPSGGKSGVHVAFTLHNPLNTAFDNHQSSMQSHWR